GATYPVSSSPVSNSMLTRSTRVAFVTSTGTNTCLSSSGLTAAAVVGTYSVQLALMSTSWSASTAIGVSTGYSILLMASAAVFRAPFLYWTKKRQLCKKSAHLVCLLFPENLIV